MKYKTLNITEETHNKLREYCNKEGIIMQHLADKILREWIEKRLIMEKSEEAKP